MREYLCWVEFEEKIKAKCKADAIKKFEKELLDFGISTANIDVRVEIHIKEFGGFV